MTQDRPMINVGFVKTLVIVALMIVLRMLLVPTSVSAEYASAIAWSQLVVFDFVTIALTPPFVVGWGQSLIRQSNLVSWFVSLTGFALYEQIC